jgi:hypothetical protein
MFWSLRRSARFASFTVSKPTNRLRRPASTASSNRSGLSTELTEGVVDGLHVAGLAALEEGVLVAEVAVVRATA